MEHQDDRAHLELCRRLMHLGRLIMARLELEHWLSLHPDDAEGHALLGWCHAQRGERREAVEAAEEAVRLAPEWAYTHAMLGSVHLAFGRMRRAERAFRAALELAPQMAEYHALLAESLLYQPLRAGAALRAAEAGLAVNPESANCARVRARALTALFRFRKARQAVQHALRLEPESAASHATAVDLEYATGNVAALRTHLREQLRLAPDNPQAQMLLGMVLEFSRKAGAFLVQAQRWARPLQWIAAAWIAEMAAVLVFAEPHIPFLVGYLLLWIGLFGGPLLWAHLRHPDIVEEMRDPVALRPEARRSVAFVLGFLIFMMFVIPPTAVLFERFA